MSFKTLLVAAMAMAIPASALAGAVTVQNKDGKKVVLVVKRSNSSMDVDIMARSTMELPGAPMTLTDKKTKEKIEAADGETVIISKGKLSKLAPVVEPTEESTPAPPDEVPPAPEKAPE